MFLMSPIEVNQDTDINLMHNNNSFDNSFFSIVRNLILKSKF